MFKVVLRPGEVLSRVWKLVFVQPSMFCKGENQIGIRTLQQNDKSTQLKFDINAYSSVEHNIQEMANHRKPTITYAKAAM